MLWNNIEIAARNSLEECISQDMYNVLYIAHFCQLNGVEAISFCLCVIIRHGTTHPANSSWLITAHTNSMERMFHTNKREVSMA